MDTLNEITTLIASSVGRELDTPFRMMIAKRVDWWRATLVSRSIEKNPAQVNLYRTPLIVPMQQYTDPLGIPMSCNKYRSSPIPKRLRYGSGKWQYVGSVDGTSPFRFAEAGQLDYLQSGKYARQTLFYEEDNHRILMRRFIPLIKIDDIFDSGTEVLNFLYPDTDIWDKPYPCGSDMLQMIGQYILETDFNKKKVEPTPQVEVSPTEQP